MPGDPTKDPMAVVDASAVCALAFGEPEADAVAGALSGFSLAAPHLLWFEVASVCRKKLARHPGSADLLRISMADALHLPIQKVEVDPPEVVGLAIREGIAAYDAAYLWLAVRLEARLVTLDPALARTAAGVLGGTRVRPPSSF